MTELHLARHGVPEDVFDTMVRVRRDLHRHPELSFEEAWTAARIAEELRALGLEPRTGVGGHGVVLDLPGDAPGPAVALRADMDALPIQEATGLPFASERPGVMHACGHDGHSAALLGAAALLAAGGPLHAPVRLIWQPAEERGNGARVMIDAGVLDGVGLIFGGHLDLRYPVGHLVVTEGPVNASTDTFVIDVRGRQGHGARPHEAVDAVLIGAHVVTALQAIVSREIDPGHPAVVSVGVFRAGDAGNVIAGHARLEGTLRAQTPAVRDQLTRAVSRVARAIGDAHGARVEVALVDGTPPLVNPRDTAALAHAAAVRVAGEDRVQALHTANMGGEDFAWFMEQVPGCYIRYGARVAGRESHPAHSSRFDFDEDALAAAAGWLAEVARVAAARLARSPGSAASTSG